MARPFIRTGRYRLEIISARAKAWFNSQRRLILGSSIVVLGVDYNLQLELHHSRLSQVNSTIQSELRHNKHRYLITKAPQYRNSITPSTTMLGPRTSQCCELDQILLRECV